MADWYYKRDERVVGPVTRQELDYLSNIGRIKSGTEVREGMKGEWRRQAGRQQPQNVSARPATEAPVFDKSEPRAESAQSMTSQAAPLTVESAVRSEPDPVKRQIAIGAMLAIALLLLLLLWIYFSRPSAPGGLEGMADFGAGDSAQADDTGDAAADGVQDSNNKGDESGAGSEAGADQSAGGAADTTTDSSTVAGNPDSPSNATSSSPRTSGQGTAADGEIGSNGSPLLPPSDTGEMATGSDAVAAGDPLSNFTISAPGEATFFGLSATGRRFVFVVDSSGSMSGIPLQRAKDELMRCVDHLPESVEATIVFFDDVAYPAPGGYKKLHRRNVASLQSWVDGFSVGGGTNVKAGMQSAFSKRPLPDAIFLLTDGQFDSDTPFFVKHLNIDGTVRINTVALVSNSGEDLLKAIASDNGGDYRFVP